MLPGGDRLLDELVDALLGRILDLVLESADLVSTSPRRDSNSPGPLFQDFLRFFEGTLGDFRRGRLLLRCFQLVVIGEGRIAERRCLRIPFPGVAVPFGLITGELFRRGLRARVGPTWIKHAAGSGFACVGALAAGPSVIPAFSGGSIGMVTTLPETNTVAAPVGNGAAADWPVTAGATP